MVRETDIRKRNTGDESLSYRDPGWGEEMASLNISYFYLEDFSIGEVALSFIGDEKQFHIVDYLMLEYKVPYPYTFIFEIKISRNKLKAWKEALLFFFAS